MGCLIKDAPCFKIESVQRSRDGVLVLKFYTLKLYRRKLPTPLRNEARYDSRRAIFLGQYSCTTVGITELACGSQAFIATLLFDPSMSALPIIPKQNSVSVGLFTH